ncbi:glycosyltransferase [Litchfieldia alkalitelluris]|uniref:glycosyltransferase n=1 Tax=Litchfieldia alkalitelluris TaxID=304268 RepID=UPI000996C997|nr:glycosyltransferase family 2 protein [Litchfieldia alkalitelluris]
MNNLKRNMNKKLAVVIPAMNEEDKIGRVLYEVKRLSPEFIIVVVNGSNDETGNIASSQGAQVLEFEEPLGNDVGRALGAMQVEADIYLFLDADIIIPAEDLLPFVSDIESGVDMALNAIDWVARHPRPHAPAIDRYFINMVQRRRDLGLENVLTIPHAFSKKALATMGIKALANPQLANAIAISKNLNIKISNDINVLKMNKKRANHTAKKGEVMSEAYQRMHGDTVEACYYLLETYGSRGGYSNGNRKNQYYEEYKDKGLKNVNNRIPVEVSIILSISDYSVYLRHLIDNIIHDNFEIIPIVHGASEKIRAYLHSCNLDFIDIPEYIGHDTAFAIGAEIANGEQLIFHDTAIPIDQYELVPFIQRLKKKEADIVINNQNILDDDDTEEIHYVGKLESMHPVHIGNYFLNITIGKNDLTISSPIVVPYGMTRKALDLIGPHSLINPCLLHMKAAHMNLTVATAGEVDIKGRINESVVPVILNHDRILGDFMEALAYWTSIYGPRGNFFDGRRKRHLLGESDGYYKIDPFLNVKEFKLNDKLASKNEEVRLKDSEPIHVEHQNNRGNDQEQFKHHLVKIIIEQLELVKQIYSPEEYEKVLREHLNDQLPLHEYYLIGKMLLNHYQEHRQKANFDLWWHSMYQKYRNYPPLLLELQYLKENERELEE